MKKNSNVNPPDDTIDFIHCSNISPERKEQLLELLDGHDHPSKSNCA